MLLTMLPARSDAERPIHRRIQARSRLFAMLFTGLLWLLVTGTAALVLGALFYSGSHVFIGADGVTITFGDGKPADMAPLASLAVRYRIGGAVALVAQMGPAILVLANLRGLFRLYASGTVFARENANHIKQIGLWLITYAVAPFLSVELLTLLDSVIDRAWFHLVELQALVLGGILLVIAQVMEAGREIELDRNGFV
jgi:hypothetical protein